ncbi:MAG: AAA family ATPase, partial [Candidatus Aenigmarchaeota archaeon]|nr:AAA family ATPase [Candidatus Aenigmarchaeota archaeon]
MIFKKLFLKNIRTFKEATIEFPKNVVLLEGDIGSGKTTILKSIEFALFGAGPQIRAASLLRKGEKTACVNLKFEMDGKEILIKRGLKKTSTGEITQIKSELVVDEVSYLCSPKEMRSKIITLLNYPKELITKDPSLLYRYTVYNPQEETKKILRIKKEERYELLGKIFSIDRYKLIKENANILKKNIRDEGEYLKGVFSNLEDYKKQCKIQKSEIIKLRKEELELEEKLASINEKKAKLNEKDKALSQKALEFEKIKKRFEIESSLRKEKTNYLIELKQREEDEKNSCAKIEEQIKEFALVKKEVDEEKIIKLTREKHDLEKEIQEHADNKKNIQIKLAGIEQNIKNKEEFILKKDKAKD